VNLVVVGPDGVLVADGQGDPAATGRLVAAIGKLTDKPIRQVVICSDHGDHTGGNASFPAGVTFLAHPASKVTTPTELVSDQRVLRLGDREVRVLFLGRAHTGGDLHVYLPREKILFMSEAYLNRVFPAMRSAYPSEWVQVLKRAEAMDVDRFVPGHGFVEEPAASREELVQYRRAMEAVIAEATRLYRAGVSLEEAVKQASWGPYASWRLSSGQGPIAVRKVYQELEGKLK
jgi:glyoxylase-like metal-dependent hydrolase (beta-lactamase superfamily II)